MRIIIGLLFSLVLISCGNVELLDNPWDPDNWEHCGDATYSPAQFCYNSEIYSKCGGMEYNPPTQYCSGGSVINSLSSSSSIKDSFTDSRDGQIYDYVTIGTQTWMAENLNYNASGSKCYSNNTANCDNYGRLYDWATAMAISTTYNTSSYTAGAKHQGVCPGGWHLPSDAEWTKLTDYVGGSSTAGNKLKAKSGWNSYSGIVNEDTYGFSALPGGDGYSDGSFYNVGYNGYWWSATESNASYAYSRSMHYNNEDVYRSNYDKDNYLFSVRCLRD
ncbi:hypothetical protein AGMMS49938_17050 [Fibrobacterales bacterium]|nr:hypothetical protein AGMMS49938_17050 [Fibrobacterales bacterium]